MLMRRPGESFDGRYMLIELHDRFVGLGAPDQELIVIASRSQFLPFKRPLKAAHLLLVADQRVDD